ncbi:MAG: hypothetical protein U9Q66_04070 [Patescibacteria group bacterium]|nr:hypothetical protein [Patescibacteria group bacterium]
MIFNNKNITNNDSYFSDKEKDRLIVEFKKLFSTLDRKYSESHGEEAIYFDEVTIFTKSSNSSFSLVFHYPEREEDKDEVNYTQIKNLIEAIDELNAIQSFEFIKDQEGLDYDYLAKILTEDNDLFVFLNNVELSLYELEERDQAAWKSMNMVNLNLFYMIKAIINN